MKVSSVPVSLDILGIPVSALESYAHAEDWIVHRVRQGQKTFCVAINPEKIHRAQTDGELKELINAANFHICDGVGTTIATRLLHGAKIARITGVQLFLNLMGRAEKEGMRVFLLGADPASNEGACNKLEAMHPNLKIAGRQDGYFKDDMEVVQRINDSGADMLFVGMGSPTQESWIAKYRHAIRASFCMGVGGTFDVLSGKVKWAPSVFRKTAGCRKCGHPRHAPPWLVRRCNLAKQRCVNPNSTAWKSYGGRGIEFRFISPLSMAMWIQKNLGLHQNLSLDRIDNNGHYEAGNLRWASRNIQMSNTRRRRLNAKMHAFRLAHPEIHYADSTLKTLIGKYSETEIINRFHTKSDKPKGVYGTSSTPDPAIASLQMDF